MGRNMVLAMLCLIAACATADTLDNQTAVNTSLANTDLTNTSSTPDTTSTSAAVAAFNVIFSVTETFTTALTNTSSPQFTAKVKSVRSQVEPYYRKSYKNFLKMQIYNFKKSANVINSSLTFNASGSIPTVAKVKTILLSASNAKLNIIGKSVKITQVSG
ncbi:uncharacterized protein Hap1MRO34_022465 [Clarias gariepinus]